MGRALAVATVGPDLFDTKMLVIFPIPNSNEITPAILKHTVIVLMESSLVSLTSGRVSEETGSIIVEGL